MKTGNPKQAAILGVVAVGALGFLGSSLFSTFASGSTPPPAQEVKVDAEPTNEVAKLPVTEPGESGADPDANEFPPKIENSPFKVTSSAQPATPKVKKQEPTRKNSEWDHGQNSGPKESEEVKPTDPFDNRDQKLPPTDEMPSGGAETPTKVEPPKPVMIRFEGYVDAGNPVAIIRIGDSQYTADKGEGLPNGIRVIAITAEKLTLSIRGRRKTIWIGREVQL